MGQKHMIRILGGGDFVTHWNPIFVKVTILTGIYLYIYDLSLFVCKGVSIYRAHRDIHN